MNQAFFDMVYFHSGGSYHGKENAFLYIGVSFSFPHFKVTRAGREQSEMMIAPPKSPKIYASATILFALVFLFPVLLGHARDESSLFGDVFDTVQPRREGLFEKLKQGRRGPWGTHYYWLDGLNILSQENKVRLRVRGQIMYDAGYIFANDSLQRRVSNTDDFQMDMRRLEVWAWGTIYDALEFKIGFDLANVRELRDNWFRFMKIKHLQRCLIGHVREQFSLENTTSTNFTTFMEKALPANALGPGRNLGIQYSIPSLDERRTFSLGFFYNTMTLRNLENPSDSISNANGYDIAARITGLPRYEDFGRRLTHLGLSYNYGSRDDDIRLSTRPESYVVDKPLVDTGEFSLDGFHNVNAEVATVSGPLSFQGEYFHAFADSKTERDPDFWGYYMYASYFLTGEYREYDTARGIFTRVSPKSYFRFREKGWGAWEIGLRHSFVDLNDRNVKGGEERNFTLGLNWYFTSKTRIMFNYVHARVDHSDGAPLEDGYLNIFMSRFRVLF